MARGGSRFGAGRPGWRVKAEHCRSLDVRRLATEDMLEPGAWDWVWRNADTGNVSSSITVYGGVHSVRLSYSVNDRHMTQEVHIERTPCGFGGSRPWFRCPCCSRRVAKLFLRQCRFACRHCQRLTYASRSEDAIDRGWRKQGKLERRLGPNGSRPRHMRHATYERIVQAVMECERRRDEALAAFCARWLPHLL